MRKILSVVGALLLCLFVNAQSSAITGQVRDNLGNPVPFATIRVQNANTGVTADSAGRFSIDAAQGAVLEITAAGFRNVTVTVGTSAIIEVTMENPEALSEVVVTALGIRRNKNELPYAAQQVRGEELTKVRTTNFANALSGKVAGLQIKQNNTMGGSTNIVLRGYKSITGDNQALLVIDGVPASNANTNTSAQRQGGGGFDYGNAGADINPDDVESVNVLKGAAATALYGSRAANGVILITTKKGRRGLGVTLNIGGGTGSMDKSTWVKYQKEYGGGYYDPEFYTYSDQPPSPDERFLYIDANGDGVRDLVIPTTEDASFGARFDPNLSVYQWSAFDPRLPTFRQATPFVAAANDPTTFFENPLSSNVSLFVDGGGDKGTFKLGYTRSDEKGILPNSRISKDMINLQTSYNITSKLTANVTVNFSKTKGLGRYGSGYSDARSLAGNFRQWWQMNVDVKELENAYRLTKDNVTWNMSGPPGDLSPIYWDNPYYTRYESFSNDYRYRTFGIASVTYAVNDWFNILARASLDSYDQLQEERDGYASVNIGSYSRFNQTFREYNYDLIANMDRNLTDKINLKALVGGNLRQNNVNSVFASTNGGLIIPNLYALSNSANPINAPTEVDQRVEVGGLFAGITLGYNQLLVLDVTARTDQSSTLPEGNNRYFYPSFSGGFIFSRLLQNYSWLNQGKLRLNYAEVGNPAPWDYTVNGFDQPTPFAGVPLFSVQGQRRNADLKPERTKSYEAGLELSLFQSRVGLDLTYYQTNTIDQIIPVTVSGATGYNTRIINAGNVENRGWEVSLTLVPVKTQNFSWTINTNWTRTRNEVKSLIGGTQNILIGSFQGGVTLNAAVGEPFGTLRGNDYVYDEKTGRPIVGDDGYYVVSQTTNNIIGNINPDWVGGINNIISYKDFSLSFLLDGRQGGSIYSIDQWYGQGTGLYQDQAGLNDLGNPKRNTLAEGGGVIFPGVLEDGTENTQRVMLTGLRGYGYNNFPNKSVVYDASYIKLREANLTWSIPQRISDRLAPVKGIDVSLFGRNLWILHKNLPDADPEDTPSSGNVQGFQVGTYPLYRTYGFNVRFKF